MADLKAKGTASQEAVPEDAVDHLADIAEALGEVYKQVALIARRLERMEQRLMTDDAPTTQPVTILTAHDEKQS